MGNTLKNRADILPFKGMEGNDVIEMYHLTYKSQKWKEYT
jgi:hypothetical protein